MSGTTPPTDFIKAKLLVAVPGLLDPNFKQTVVLMLEHNDDGALGLILNRPRLVGGAEAVPHWADRLAWPSRLHKGGPVSTDSIIGLGIGSDESGEGVSPLLGRLGVVDLHRDPVDLPGVEEVRLFAGYAGWTAGQLETELAAGGWIVVDACEEDVRSADPEALWRVVLARQAGMVALLGDYPDRPDLN
ncbi:MAG: YqgE/AlgH family protein [Acidimicrobiales bacterium]|nr:YqgE/AlgH family protein [Acidimicrobiales bacterium]